MTDYYKVLEVAKGATDDEIKTAYRRLAKRYHPDRNKGDKGAEEKFKDINEAYETLKDPQKREVYDRNLDNPFRNTGWNSFDGFGDTEGFGSVFGAFARGFARGAGSRGTPDYEGFSSAPPKPKPTMTPSKGVPLVCNLPLNMREVFNGCTKKIRVRRDVQCPHCHGKSYEGSAPEWEKCSDCEGRGDRVVKVDKGYFTSNVKFPCQKCEGKGWILKNKCPHCDKQGVVEAVREMTVVVPPAVGNHQEVFADSDGHAGAFGGVKGKLVVQAVHTNVDPIFKVETRGFNSELVLYFPISFTLAVTGGKVTVPVLGGTREIDVPAGSMSGTEMCIADAGRYTIGGSTAKREHLVVRFVVEPPTEITPEQIEALKNVFTPENYPKTQMFYKDWVENEEKP